MNKRPSNGSTSDDGKRLQAFAQAPGFARVAGGGAAGAAASPRAGEAASLKAASGVTELPVRAICHAWVWKKPHELDLKFFVSGTCTAMPLVTWSRSRDSRTT